MNALNVTDYMQTLGLQAKTASALMARAPAAIKNKALKALARLLREQTDALQTDNARDLERAIAAGLEAPMVDRLRLTPKVLRAAALISSPPKACRAWASVASWVRGVSVMGYGVERMPKRKAARDLRPTGKTPSAAKSVDERSQRR